MRGVKAAHIQNTLHMQQSSGADSSILFIGNSDSLKTFGERKSLGLEKKKDSVAYKMNATAIVR